MVVALLTLTIVVFRAPKFERFSFWASALLAIAAVSPAVFTWLGPWGLLAAFVGVLLVMHILVSALKTLEISLRVRALSKVLSNATTDVNVRLGAIKEATQLQAGARAQVLSRALRDPDVSVRFAVAQAYTHIGPDLREGMSPLLADPEYCVRNAAATAWKTSEPPPSEPPPDPPRENRSDYYCTSDHSRSTGLSRGEPGHGPSCSCCGSIRE
jgi:hypothetical protein